MRKGKFRAGQLQTATVGAGEFRAQGDPVIVDSGTGVFQLLKTTLSIIGIGLLVAFVVYFFLASTLIRAIPSPQGGFDVVRNATFVGGIPEPGDLVYAAPATSFDDTFLGKAKQAFIGVEGGSVLTIVAGPKGTVSNGDDGYLYVDGESTSYKGSVKDGSVTLNGKYVAICVSGACTTDETYVIGQNTIVAEATGTLSGITYTPYPSKEAGE